MPECTWNKGFVDSAASPESCKTLLFQQLCRKFLLQPKGWGDALASLVNGNFAVIPREIRVQGTFPSPPCLWIIPTRAVFGGCFYFGLFGVASSGDFVWMGLVPKLIPRVIGP